MQTRFFVIALAAGLVLVLGAFWQLAAPAKRARPRIPDRMQLDAPTTDHAPQPLPGPVVAQAPVELPDLPAAPSPPPPVVDNNPASGRVWLRVIDAATNRPLAGTNCRLMPVGWNEFYGYTTYLSELSPAAGSTDADGLIALSAQVISGNEVADDSVQVVIDADTVAGVRFVVPVPEGWYPTQDTGQFSEALGDLSLQADTAPIDVPLMRTGSVRITSRDRYGAPVPDARLYASLLVNRDTNEEWVSAFCAPLTGTWAEDWREDTDDMHRVIRRDHVSCRLLGAADGQAESGPPSLAGDAVSNQFGTFDYRDLPCTGIGVLAWHPLYGTAHASIQVAGGHNALDVYFTDELCCELRVRVDWAPLPRQAADLDVALHRTGPQGLAECIEDSDDWFARDWYFDDAGHGPRELVFSGVPPGWWHVGMDDGDTSAGANILLAPGESRTLRMHLGEDAQAHWTPVIRSGGVQLQESSLYLLGGHDPGRDEHTVYFDPESGETDALLLAPGPYTAWLPTLEPFHFVLSPGEQRTDLFELLSINVAVTLGKELAEWLGNPEAGARLDLLPRGVWDDARAHLYALDASVRKRDPDYDLLKPGVTRAWSLPPGEYEWQIYGDSNELSGTVSFSRSGPTALHFGLDGLPGYALLDVNLIGFPVDDPPDVELDDDSREHLGLQPAERHWYSGPSISMPGMFESQLFEVPTERVELSDTRRIFFAPAGLMRLRVRHDGDTRVFAVNFPARITIHAHEIARHGFRTLTVRCEGPSPDNPTVTPEEVIVEMYSIELSDGDTWFQRADDHDACEVPPGEFTARVMRSRFQGQGRGVCDYAEVSFARGAEDLALNLWTLKYKPCATLDLVFKGRGSPEQATDAWWFAGPQAPRLYALDGPTPRLVSVTEISEYMPNGRLEFACRDISLPPGKYRVVPWVGAPARYITEFTLQSGRHSVVTVQGG